MKIKEIIRHLFGFIIACVIFGFMIPYGLYILSLSTNHFIQINLLGNIAVRVFAWLLFIIGIVFILWSNIYLFAIGKGGPADWFGKTVSPRSKYLVTKGPYRFSRNPMVFGGFSGFFATALLFNSIIGIGVVILLFCFSIPMIKFFEEKRLLNDFGEQYIQYRQKVSIIIPWPKK
jgi:protein-S-isoprenylcysteine O-methyltransferase Ste14